MDGHKEILGTWISENESASICSDLKNRGVEDIFVACHDNLTGLCEAINSIFSKTKNQLCIVHRIRNSCKFVSYKDRKVVCADLKRFIVRWRSEGSRAEYYKRLFRGKSILHSSRAALWFCGIAEKQYVCGHDGSITYLRTPSQTRIITPLLDNKMTATMNLRSCAFLV